jgi:DNA-binding transcriptional LysR family regulator
MKDTEPRACGLAGKSGKQFPYFGKTMTDLNALIIFAKVVEAKSFSEAARRLGMPISTVSRRVAELEEQLGVRLLDRSTRSLRLTDLGAEVLDHAMRSVEINEAVESIVSNQLSKVTGTLRLSAPPNISETLITPLITAFQASYPNVRVQILIAERFVDHIADGVDIVFRLGTLKDSSLVAQKILTYRHQLVASPHYLESHETPKNAARPASPPAAGVLVRTTGSQLDLPPRQRQGPRNTDVPAVPINERFCRSHARASGRRRDRGPSPCGAARLGPRRPPRRGHAELALPRPGSVASASRQPAHAQGSARVQGVCCSDGANAVL